MTQVLTLIAATGGPRLAAAELRAAQGVLGALGAECAPPDWLAPGLACDLGFAGIAPRRAEAAVRDALGAAPIDLAVRPMEGRRKRLLVADMDSTIIDVECIDELAEPAGLRPRIAAITERAMRGELDFAGALRERVALLAGLREDTIEAVWRERVRLNPGARTLVQTMRAHGAYTMLVSGGFRQFTARVREAAGFDADRANTLVIEASVLTGRVVEPILGAEAKLAALEAACAERGLVPEQVLAVGDGANDLAMVRAAGLGVAYRGKPVLQAAADAVIAHADLSALLYLQGYRQAEFRH